MGWSPSTIMWKNLEQKAKKAKQKQAPPIRRPNEIKVDEETVCGLQGNLEVKGKQLQQFSRVTTVFSEMGQTRDLQQDEAIQAYDILAVQPTTEKLFHTACTELEVDIISVDMTQRLPFFFRRQSIGVVSFTGTK
ncbi:Ribonuclease P protein subunit p30 [Lamellibrachia satsuma]|nr:Ribonuclease P protein subunit p30 [Lamellibrachia satsuma]